MIRPQIVQKHYEEICGKISGNSLLSKTDLMENHLNTCLIMKSFTFLIKKSFTIEVLLGLPAKFTIVHFYCSKSVTRSSFEILTACSIQGERAGEFSFKIGQSQHIDCFIV